MQLKTSYKQILSISVPIILGSAVQNVIALSDSVFLYHKSEQDFAAIGFVSVFYLIIAAIGYGFSKGGQIIIARRMGEQDYTGAGKSFSAMLIFELALASLMFLLLYYGSPWMFSLMIDSESVYLRSLDYIEYRSFGVFFSYMGVALIALYTGIARTTFIIVDTVVLALVNITLNYALIFGKWGFEAQGIAGAAMASTIAEIVAFVLFVGYMILDKKINPLFPDWRSFVPKLQRFKGLVSISLPIVMQSIIGLGAWLFFFAKVENLGERELAETNLVRLIYLILSVPAWGFSSGINTMVSGFIGARKRVAVMPIILKSAKLCLGVTLLLTIPVVLFPKFFLFPLLGGQDMSLFDDAQPVLNILILVLASFSFGAVFYNGLTGTGATRLALIMQFVFALIYILLIEVSITWLDGNLVMAWMAEAVYWGLILLGSIWYIRTKHWHKLKV